MASLAYGGKCKGIQGPLTLQVYQLFDLRRHVIGRS